MRRPIPRLAGPARRGVSAAPVRLALSLLLLAGLAVAVVLRRTDAVTNPQFFAEDGRYWFQEAYNDGRLHAFLTPHGGYFQTIERLGGALGVTLGLGRAPAASNAIALLLELVPAAFLLTPRFAAAVPAFGVRLGLAALTVAMPDVEIHGNLTNAQWHLALLAVMVLIAADDPRRRWRAFDIGVLVLCGLSGPFVVLLLPLAGLRWLLLRRRVDLLLVAVTAPLALLQGITTLFTAAGDRSTGPLGAGWQPLVRIIANRVVIGGTVGNDRDTGLFTQAWPHGLVIASALSAIAVTVFAAVIWRGPFELRLLGLFAVGILAVSLIKPHVNEVIPQWGMMAELPAGDRYFLIPMLAWAASLVWLITRLPRRVAVSIGSLAAIGFGVHAAENWRFPSFIDMHPSTYAAQLDAAPPGSTVTVPINPPGWTMILTPH